MFQPTRTLQRPKSLHSPQPRSRLLPGAGPRRSLPPNAHALHSSLLVSGQHLRPLPQRILLPIHGDRPTRRLHPPSPPQKDLLPRLQTPQESTSRPHVLLHRVVSVRVHQNITLGLPPANLGHFLVRRSQSSV